MSSKTIYFYFSYAKISPEKRTLSKKPLSNPDKNMLPATTVVCEALVKKNMTYKLNGLRPWQKLISQRLISRKGLWKKKKTNLCFLQDFSYYLNNSKCYHKAGALYAQKIPITSIGITSIGTYLKYRKPR